MSDLPTSPSETPAEPAAAEAAPAEAAAPAAPATPQRPAISLALGESTPVAQNHLDAILPVERALHQALLNLGAHQEKAHVEGLFLQQQVAAARKVFETAVKAAGIGTGLNFDGDFLYNYSQEKRTFTRTK